MSGRVPPSSKAARRRRDPVVTGRALEDAKRLYREFTGMTPESVSRVKMRVPRVALVIGECDGVLYSCIRDGKRESYIHRFRRKSRPLLLTSSDGRSLLILGGGFQFTDRGIEDR